MSHPYSPQSASVPGYVPNDTPIVRLAASFAALTGAVIGSALWVASQPPFRHWLRKRDVFAIGWFALCGFLHCFFEGYFIYYQGELAGMQTLFAQLWKYYSLADSRYITLDNFTICIETVTALLWGPLSWLTVVAILVRSPSRHFFQTIMCIAHLYGVALYFATEYRNEKMTGESASLPGFLYYWVFYFGFNFVWAVVPIWLLYDSWAAITNAIQEKDAKEVQRKAE